MGSCTKFSHMWKTIGNSRSIPELYSIEVMPRLFNSAPTSFLDYNYVLDLEWAPGDARGSTTFATLDALKIAVNKAGQDKNSRCCILWETLFCYFVSSTSCILGENTPTCTCVLGENAPTSCASESHITTRHLMCTYCRMPHHTPCLPHVYPTYIIIIPGENTPTYSTPPLMCTSSPHHTPGENTPTSCAAHHTPSENMPTSCAAHHILASSPVPLSRVGRCAHFTWGRKKKGLVHTVCACVTKIS